MGDDIKIRKLIKAILKEGFLKYEKTILIRSKLDKTLRFDITYKNNKIFKIETQGDYREKMKDKSWLNLFLTINTGEEMNFDKLRSVLSELPELYVKDIE